MSENSKRPSKADQLEVLKAKFAQVAAERAQKAGGGGGSSDSSDRRKSGLESLTALIHNRKAAEASKGQTTHASAPASRSLTPVRSKAVHSAKRTLTPPATLKHSPKHKMVPPPRPPLHKVKAPPPQQHPQRLPVAKRPPAPHKKAAHPKAAALHAAATAHNVSSGSVPTTPDGLSSGVRPKAKAKPLAKKRAAPHTPKHAAVMPPHAKVKAKAKAKSPHPTSTSPGRDGLHPSEEQEDATLPPPDTTVLHVVAPPTDAGDSHPQPNVATAAGDDDEAAAAAEQGDPSKPSLGDWERAMAELQRVNRIRGLHPQSRQIATFQMKDSVLLPAAPDVEYKSEIMQSLKKQADEQMVDKLTSHSRWLRQHAQELFAQASELRKKTHAEETTVKELAKAVYDQRQFLLNEFGVPPEEQLKRIEAEAFYVPKPEKEAAAAAADIKQHEARARPKGKGLPAPSKLSALPAEKMDAGAKIVRRPSVASHLSAESGLSAIQKLAPSTEPPPETSEPSPDVVVLAEQVEQQKQKVASLVAKIEDYRERRRVASINKVDLRKLAGYLEDSIKKRHDMRGIHANWTRIRDKLRLKSSHSNTRLLGAVTSMMKRKDPIAQAYQKVAALNDEAEVVEQDAEKAVESALPLLPPPPLIDDTPDVEPLDPWAEENLEQMAYLPENVLALCEYLIDVGGPSKAATAATNSAAGTSLTDTGTLTLLYDFHRRRAAAAAAPQD